MQRESREHWFELCAKAAQEQDPAKLLKLVEEINRLLQEKDSRLRPQSKSIQSGIEMSNDQESKLLAEESAQEKNRQKLFEIILSLAAAINEQKSQSQTEAPLPRPLKRVNSANPEEGSQFPTRSPAHPESIG